MKMPEMEARTLLIEYIKVSHILCNGSAAKM
jgi:hypothetical protein